MLPDSMNFETQNQCTKNNGKIDSCDLVIFICVNKNNTIRIVSLFIPHFTEIPQNAIYRLQKNKPSKNKENLF